MNVSFKSTIIFKKQDYMFDIVFKSLCIFKDFIFILSTQQYIGKKSGIQNYKIGLLSQKYLATEKI